MEFAGIPLGAVVSPTVIKTCQVNTQSVSSTKGTDEDLVLVPVHSAEADGSNAENTFHFT